jgi:hypothetical protein
MAGRRSTPVFTENFARNVEALRLFLGAEGGRAFSRLLDRLFDDIIPTLCRFPQSGPPLPRACNPFHRDPDSRETAARSPPAGR